MADVFTVFGSLRDYFFRYYDTRLRSETLGSSRSGDRCSIADGVS